MTSTPDNAMERASPVSARRVFAIAMAAMFLWWASLPPLGWWPLAWFMPVPLVWIIRQIALAGRRAYLSLYFAGSLYWIATLHFLRLPHPATSIGWFALSFYLGVYLLFFVLMTRAAVHRHRVHLPLAAAIIWTGLEYAQTHLLSGFNMASLGHSQYRCIPIIQIADLGGAYAVTFLVMFVGATIGNAIFRRSFRSGALRLIPAMLAVGGAWAYSFVATPEPTNAAKLRFALIQGSIDSDMKADPQRNNEILQQYLKLSRQAVARGGIDLVIWPETMFRPSLWVLEPGFTLPPEADFTREQMVQNAELRRGEMLALAADLGTPVLLGVDTYVFEKDRVERFNSAVLVAPGKIQPGRYDKMHLVMFGEYIPLGSVIPWLYNISPLGAGLDAGAAPVSFTVKDARLAPNICFETLVPHLLRRQILDLRAKHAEPDILVNLTNDGWFWGSSELDLHLICGVFRVIECRKPLLIAANTGFSAYIDLRGVIRSQGPRRETGILIEDVSVPSGRSRGSLYLRIGDWLGGGCLFAWVGIAGFALFEGRRLRRAAVKSGVTAPPGGPR